MDLSIFKAYDVRGIYPTEIDEEAAEKVGRALARYLSAKTIVVGRDMRASSPSLSEKMIEGITCEGADVIDLGECTTPMLNFAVANYGYDGGVMISASHNPAEYNAFKLIAAGAEMLDESHGLPEIKNLVERGFSECKQVRGTVTKKEILTDYASRVLKFADGISGLKIVVDYGNGMGAVSAKPILARLDLDVVELYAEPDGSFPNHPANPHDVANFSELREKVKSEGADLGVFFDGDADRALFVDENGNLAPIDLVSILLAKAELAENPGEKIYYDLRFTKSTADEIKAAGGEPVMMRVGNPFYKRVLKKEGGILGAEFSGHLMFAENFCIDDGIFATIKLLNLLSQNKAPLSKQIEAVNHYESSDEASFEAANPSTVPERLTRAFPSAKLIELDGTYLDFSDGFISVRQSQSEPKLFRMRVEAKTKDELQKRIKKTEEILQG